ncbi:polymerase delta-interacting protein 3 [Patella vulgata]|uniref:polymerase delta-interacting protein 3 n=1 Tax=Patella vulgata TaxID=6465 RepID=UPI0024A9403B|nr:polymerase delta-interacting protein 3 [Patella vulgata]
MADLSLDDYMGKKNFKVQFQNNYVNKPTQIRQKTFPNKSGLTTKKNFTVGRNGAQNRMHTNFGGVQKKNFAIQSFQNSQKPARAKLSKPMHAVTVTGLGNKNIFDARQKLSSNTKTGATNTNGNSDARQKIITAQKQKGIFDARSRIKTKTQPNTGQPALTGPKVTAPTGPKVTITGLGNVKKNVNNPQQGIQIGGKGGITKTLKNEFANGGSHVEVFGNSIQITRSVPNKEVKFDGKNKLTITKRASLIQDTQPVKRTRSPIQWSSNDATSPSPPKRANLIKTYKTADAIQSAAGKAAIERLRMPPPVSTSPKNTIPVITSMRRDALTVAKRKASPTETASSPQLMKAKTKSVYRPVTIKQEQPDVYEAPVMLTEEEEPVDQLLSPLQGYKITVTNLDPVVSQDDLIELFGAIGALKRAKISRPGIGEVVYVKKEDAQKAATKYHNRELDGLPMQVKLVTPLAARIQQVAHEDESSSISIPDSLKFPKPSAMTSSVVEVPLIHKALFKIGTQVSTKPVTFTVKI